MIKDFVAPDDPLSDPESMRILITCLMRRLGSMCEVFGQEDFDAVRGMGLQGAFYKDGFALHRADSVSQLPRAE